MNRRSPIVLVLLLVIPACAAGEGSSALVASTPSPAGAVPAAETPSADPVSTAEPIPSAELGEFTCDLPVVEPATRPAVTNYTDVRVGTHDGYDRVVFEFNTGTPEFTLDHAEPPFEEEPGGIPIDVEGASVLHLTLRASTALTETGEISYDGPKNIDPGFPMLVDVVHGGDFEAQTSWFIGLAEEACVRVTLLTGPDRIVIDAEQ